MKNLCIETEVHRVPPMACKGLWAQLCSLCKNTGKNNHNSIMVCWYSSLIYLGNWNWLMNTISCGMKCEIKCNRKDTRKGQSVPKSEGGNNNIIQNEHSTLAHLFSFTQTKISFHLVLKRIVVVYMDLVWLLGPIQL